MDIIIAEKIRELRTKKKVSQEKLAEHLNITFQSVSKWENGTSYPDITLLPKIANYFEVSVDELLGVDEIREKEKYEMYYKEAETLHNNGYYKEHLELWKKAYEDLPSNYDVLSYLMSAYYDADCKKYSNEIIELGQRIIEKDTNNLRKHHAIELLIFTYDEIDNKEMAKKYLKDTVDFRNCYNSIAPYVYEGNDRLHIVQRNYLLYLSYMWHWVANTVYDKDINLTHKDKQDILKACLGCYESILSNGDAECYFYENMYYMYGDIAKLGIHLNDSEDQIKYYLNKALDCAIKFDLVKKHQLTNPMTNLIIVEDTPEGKKGTILQKLYKFLNFSDFDKYRNSDWFIKIVNFVNKDLA